MPLRLRTRAAQNELILEIQRYARAFARGLVKRQDVDDVAGEVIVLCLERLRSGAWRKLPKNLQALVRQLVKARVADRQREQRLAERYDMRMQWGGEPAEQACDADDAGWDEESIFVYQQAGMDRLPPRCRQAYRMVRVEDASYKEAAARMNVSVATIREYVVQAHRLFREQLRLTDNGDRSIVTNPPPAYVVHRSPGAANRSNGDGGYFTSDAGSSSSDAGRTSADVIRSSRDEERSTVDVEPSSRDASRSISDVSRSARDAVLSTRDAARSTRDAAHSTRDAAGSNHDALPSCRDAGDSIRSATHFKPIHTRASRAAAR